MNANNIGIKIVCSLWRAICVKWIPRIAYPVVCGPLRGAWFIFRSLSGEGGGVSVYFNRVEPTQTPRLVDSLKRGGVFFDIGANVGYYTLLASRKVGISGRVVSVEPVVRNLAMIHAHMRLNKIRNVMIVPSACSDQTGLAVFSSGRNFATGHITLLDSIDEGESFEEVTVVPIITVDLLVSQLGIAPDVVKIDVEGAELTVLNGAVKTLRESRPKIFLSIHSDMLRTGCGALLTSCGYRCAPLDGSNTTATEFIWEHVGQ